MNWMREKLSTVLGSFGLILYYLISLFFAVVPFAMLHISPWLVGLIVLAIMFLGSTIGSLISSAFWIWALISTISGPQDTLAIIYYVLFGVNFLRFAFCFLPLFKK